MHKISVTQEHLVKALPNADPAAVGRLFDVFAAGADEIDYRLFVCAAAVMADAEPSAKMQLVFELCDEDAGGSLSRAELRETLGSLLSAVSALSVKPASADATSALADGLTSAVLAEADTDKDGGISRHEFSKWVGGVAEQRMRQEEKTLRALVDARLRCEANVAAAQAWLERREWALVKGLEAEVATMQSAAPASGFMNELLYFVRQPAAAPASQAAAPTGPGAELASLDARADRLLSNLKEPPPPPAAAPPPPPPAAPPPCVARSPG